MNERSNFIKSIIENDLNEKKYKKIVTRFPPEPNGYLHIGHVRAVIVNFELAKHFSGYTNLRYDDTNPLKENDIFVTAILDDIRWLGYEPKNIFFASSYFEEMYQRAVILIKKGLAYVDDQTPEEITKSRGDLITPGLESLYRNRTISENLELFAEMRKGSFEEGKKVLRAKIDMKSSNINMRDPVIYRITYSNHHRTNDNWCIYPMYDFAHPIEDAIEGITHSLCSLEFEDHRPLYEWIINNTEMENNPRQIEFGRLSIENTVMSKRHLRYLVENKLVNGWDDPRLPTLLGLRKRGYTPNAIKNFILDTGLSKVNSTVSNDMLEHHLREDLKYSAKRVMAVKKPLKVIITNYPDAKIEYLTVPYNSDNLSLGERAIPFSKNLYIEEDDFQIIKPDNKFKRLSLHGEVRLFHAYFIKCNEVIYNKDGSISELLCTYDVKTKSGSGFNERKPDGTLHFVSADLSKKATFIVYGPLIIGDSSLPLEERVNKNSLLKFTGFVEYGLKDALIDQKFQFVRDGYYNTVSEGEELIFNQTVELKNSYK